VAGEIVFVTSDDRMEAVVSRIGSGPLALDVEADSLHHYHEKVCLIQLGFAGTVALVDTLAAFDPAPLARVLADTSIRKVIHGADYDLRILHRDFGFEVAGLFDTVVAARLTGARAFGLSALVEARLGVKLSKAHQRADWSRRPLSPEMIEYAAQDVRYLLPLAEQLERDLGAMGRLDWAREEFRRLEAVRWTAPARDPLAFRGMKGASDLDGRGLAVLRELHRLREEEASRRDVPPFRRGRDELLVEVSREQPRSEAELAGLRAGSALCRQLSTARVWAAIETAGSLAEGDLPPRVWAALEPAGSPGGGPLPPRGRRPRKPRDHAFESDLHSLLARRDVLARSLDLEPSVLAPRGLLDALLRRSLSGEPLDTTPGLRGWQANLLLPLLAGPKPVVFRADGA
jgi:ribonuclease D